MPYFQDINVLFIHIPKTGGTMIEDSIQRFENMDKKREKMKLFSSYTNNILPSPYNKTSLQHQFFTTIYRYRDLLDIDFNNLKIFTVVRNPYDRLISDLFFLKLIKQNFSSSQVFNIIKDNYIYRTNIDNHNVPQYKYISDDNGCLIENIKVFKTELLNEENEQLNLFLKKTIDIKRKDVNKDYSKYLNSDSIDLINNFYRKDFELFGYEMKNI